MEFGWRDSMEGAEQEMNVIHQQVIIYGRYIQLYDAMSLSSIDIDANGNLSGSMPKLDGCMLLFKELMDLFNKAYIRQHSFLTQLKTEVELETSNVDAVLSPASLPSNVEEGLVEKLIDVDEVVEVTNVTMPIISKNSAKEAVTIQKNHVKSRLRQIYIALTAFMDVKLALFQCAQEIISYYENSIKSLAEQNGVLHASIKYQIVVQPFMDSLLGHKLFNTVEVLIIRFLAHLLKILTSSIFITCYCRSTIS